MNMIPILKYLKLAVTYLKRLWPIIYDYVWPYVESYLKSKKNKKTNEDNESLLVKKLQEDQRLLEKQALDAFNTTTNEAWKVRREHILSLIKSKQTKYIFYMVRIGDTDLVNNILGNSKFSSDYKALKIVELMQQHTLKRRF